MGPSRLSSLEVTHLLESNDPPLDTDVLPIRHFLGEKQSRLDDLNAKIDELQAALGQLLSERDEVADLVQRHSAILAPIRRVPIDVLSEIFSWTSFTRRVRGTERDSPPWILGHICQSWRSLVLSSPLLWRSIEIIPDVHPMSMLQSQLLRSAHIPLDITLRWEGNAHEMALLSLLVTHCLRWRALHVKVASKNTKILMRLRDIYGRVPQLTRFTFEDTTNIYSVDHEVSFLSQAPSLREVIFTDSTFLGLAPRFQIPWAQITRYRGSFRALDQLHILSTCSNLVDCSLLSTAPRIPPSDVPISLPRLRRLRVEDSCGLLSHIVAPRLEELLMEANFPAVLPLISRSSCRLRSLILCQGCQFDSSSAFADLLRALPNLEHLAIVPVGNPSLSHIWDVMTISGTDSQATLCPNLQSFTCRWHERIDSMLAVMLRSRHGQLRVLRFVSRDHERVSEEELKRVVEECPGLDVAVLKARKLPSF
ncbi:hypothetical protein FB45DRAFT_927946 [Roridomyces roridus]|uniref:F-box domain-containing protein n=1 Tax=Roridomyces roridus TaxID=1738132 RepID=A0AAD7FHR6_9AGAR|nr:hypothetical protein FB45DRAFT_927946 [Roridomyces roridus]